MSNPPLFVCACVVPVHASVTFMNTRWAMTCDEIRPLLATRRQLSYAQEHAVQTHLSNCAYCTAAWQREERIMRQFRTLPAPAGELAEDTKQTLRRTMHMQRPRRHQRIQRWVLAGIAST